MCNATHRIAPRMLATSLALILAEPALFAQQADPSSSPRVAATLKSVVVNAEKRSERLEDVPIPITVIDAGTLDTHNLVKLENYYATVPGLSLTSSGNGQSSLSIRGITTGGLTSPTVGITIDDVPFGSSTALGYGSRTFPDLDPSAIAQIEVLRGPQGTLYGASSLGGLIKISTVDPDTGGFYGRAELDGSSTVGGGMGYGVRAAVNVPLSDSLAVRASAFRRQDPGYVDDPSLGRQDVNTAEVKGGRVSALWAPADAFSLKLDALAQNLSSDGTSEVDTNYLLQPTLGDLKQSRLRGTGAYDLKNELYSATATVNLRDMTLTSVSGYGVSKYKGSIDRTGNFGSLANNFFGVTGAALVNDFKTDKFSQELRLRSSNEQRVEWLVGGFYTRENTPADQKIVAIDPTTGQWAGVLGDLPFPTTYEEHAAFGNLTWHMTSKFDVQLGARRSHIAESYSEVDTGPLVGGVFVNPSSRAMANASTFQVTPRFKLTPSLMMYARVASGYRAGGPNADASLYGLPLAYRPDKTVNYEFGVKGDALNRTLGFDVSIYHINWTGIQLQLTDPGSGVAYFVNGGEAKSEGLELSLNARPAQGLTIVGSTSLGDAKLSEDLLAGAGDGRSGDRLPYSAKWTASLMVEQSMPINDRIVGFVGAKVSYVGNRYGTFAPSADVHRVYLPGYSDVDVHVGANLASSWRVTLFVKNVADERGVLGGAPLTGLGGVNDPFTVNYIQPRTFGISVSNSF